MKHSILIMRDIKANYYLPPMFAPNIGVAIRQLGDALRDAQPQFDWQKHPEDFELWNVGTWESDTAEFVIFEEEMSLGLLSALKG